MRRRLSVLGRETKRVQNPFRWKTEREGLKEKERIDTPSSASIFISSWCWCCWNFFFLLSSSLSFNSFLIPFPGLFLSRERNMAHKMLNYRWRDRWRDTNRDQVKEPETDTKVKQDSFSCWERENHFLLTWMPLTEDHEMMFLPRRFSLSHSILFTRLPGAQVHGKQTIGVHDKRGSILHFFLFAQKILKN